MPGAAPAVRPAPPVAVSARTQRSNAGTATGIHAQVLPIQAGERHLPASRAKGIGAREKYSARPVSSVTTFTLFGITDQASPRAGAAAVPISSPPRHPFDRAGQRLDGEERFVRPGCSRRCRTRRIPVGQPPRQPGRCQFRWLTRSVPPARQRARRPGRPSRRQWRPPAYPPARSSRTRCTTRVTSGSPARSCSGLWGSRVEPSRAGMTPRTRISERNKGARACQKSCRNWGGALALGAIGLRIKELGPLPDEAVGESRRSPAGS